MRVPIGRPRWVSNDHGMRDCLKHWMLTGLGLRERVGNAAHLLHRYRRGSSQATLRRRPSTDDGSRQTAGTLVRHRRAAPATSQGRVTAAWADSLNRTTSAPRDGWSPGLAWAIGLIATDGNLSPDGRHLVVRSKDRDMLETLRRCLGLSHRITLTSNGRGGRIHTLQWSDRVFYRWLLAIGLTPAKSMTLRPLAVPGGVLRRLLPRLH